MYSRKALLFLCSAVLLCVSLNLVSLQGCTTPEPQENNQETTPEASPEVTPEATPEPSNEIIPTEAGPEATPEPQPEPTPEAGPEPTPEPQPEPAPEADPEPQPETTPEAGPEAMPEPAMEAAPEMMGSNSPNSTDQAVVFQWVQQSGYTSWARAPGFATRQPSNTAHSRVVEIFVNPVVEQIINNQTQITEWPLGSIIIKDGFNNSGTKTLIAYMEKTSNGWLWLEWNPSGGLIAQGSICVGCHSSGDDFVRGFNFP